MPTIKLRLYYPGFMMGPGKAELLERIHDTGSISAAGRQMDMSYKRAWSLVELMNSAFKEPLVISERGGRGGGGAVLSPAGLQVVAEYRRIEAATTEATTTRVEALGAMLKAGGQEDIPEGK